MLEYVRPKFAHEKSSFCPIFGGRESSHNPHRPPLNQHSLPPPYPRTVWQSSPAKRIGSSRCPVRAPLPSRWLLLCQFGSQATDCFKTESTRGFSQLWAYPSIVSPELQIPPPSISFRWGGLWKRPIKWEREGETVNPLNKGPALLISGGGYHFLLQQ